MIQPQRCWFVLLAGFFIQGLTFGPIVSLGVYFLPLRNALHCSQREAAMFGSVAYGTTCLSGPLSAILYHTVGPRILVMLGGTLATLGYILAFFTTSIDQLAATQALVGLGSGLSMTPGLAIQTEYFTKYRFFAVGFVTVGSATGIMLFPPFMLFLISKYTWRGSLLIMAGIVSHLVVCGALMKQKNLPKEKRFLDRFKSSLATVCDVHLFKNLSFVLICLECSMWCACSYIFYSMINAMMVDHGVQGETAAVLVSVSGAFNILGRVLASIISHFPRTPRPSIYMAATFLLAIMSFLCTLCYNSWSFAIVTALFGFGFGVMLTTLGTVIVELFGASNLATGQGFAAFFAGIGGLTAPLIGGSLADKYSLRVAFYFSGSLGLVASFLCLLIVLREKTLDKERLHLAVELDQAEPECIVD